MKAKKLAYRPPVPSLPGRVLAQAQASTMDVPPMDNSAMDGYAIRVSDLSSSNAKLKIAQRIPAGSVGKPLEPGTAARIFTGAPIPPGADAVVMQEHCAQDGDAVIIKHKGHEYELKYRRNSGTFTAYNTDGRCGLMFSVATQREAIERLRRWHMLLAMRDLRRLVDRIIAEGKGTP